MIRRLSCLFGMVLLAATGCAGVSAPRDPFLDRDGGEAETYGGTDTQAGDAATEIGRDGPRAGSGRFVNSGAQADQSSTDSAAAPQGAAEIDAALAQIDPAGRLDAEAKARLRDDLAKTSPEMRPLLLRNIEASLRYRDELASAKEAQPRAETAQQSPPGDQRPPQQTAAKAQSPPWNKLEPPPLDRQATDEIVRELALRLAEKDSLAAATAIAAGRSEGSSYAPKPAADGQLVSAESPAPRVQAAATNLASAASAALAEPGLLAAEASATATPLNPASGAPANSFAANTAGAATIQQATYEPSADEPGYEDQIARAIERLEQLVADPQSNSADRQQTLRLLYLAAGRREDAVRPIADLSLAEQDYWTRQFWGVATMVDPRRADDPERRAAEAKQHVEGAAAKLGELASLVVRNLAFCTEVSSWGVYKPFDKYEFTPGQQALLYAEVENIKSIESAHGYHTALRSGYQILDAQGRVAASQDFPLMEEDCQNPRRDYFVRFHLFLPANLFPGHYKLQLMIEDTLSRKVGQSTIDFEIKQPK